MKKIKVVSFFSGCGGGDLGLTGGFSFLGKDYKKLPFDFVFANDNNYDAVQTYNANFKHPAVCADIKSIDEKEIPDHDLLIGGFPCQTFSMVGNRKGFQDPRGLLYQEMIRVLKAKKPKVFIGENVKGLISVGRGKVFHTMIEDFKKAGYNLHYSILDASNYGIPQKRQRFIVVGIRKDIKKEFIFPKSLLKQAVLKDVMENNNKIDSKYYFSKRALEGLEKANKAFNKGRAQDPAKPCNTISTHLAKVSLNGTDPVILVKPGIYRRLTPREASRIQSFPNNFKFIGTDSKKYVQIGNAIPPVLMWYIGIEISRQLFDYGHVHSKKTKRDNVEDKIEKHISRESNFSIA